MLVPWPALRSILLSMKIGGVAFSPEEADELLVQCDELVGLMSLWRKRSAEVQRAAQDLSALAGLTPRKLTPRPGSGLGVSAERQRDPPSLQVGLAKPESTPARPQSGHREVREAQTPSIFHWSQGEAVSRDKDHENHCSSGRDDASNSGDSDLDVDEVWTRRHDLDRDSDSGEEAEDEPIVRLPSAFAFLGRMAPVILERIDEGQREDAEPILSQSSSSADQASDETSSHDSSVERAWASVPEVGYGSSSSSTADAVAALAVAAPVAPLPLGVLATESVAPAVLGCSRKSKKERRRGRTTRRRPEQRYREQKRVESGVSDVLASWRTRRGSPGPKDEGPLTRMQERIGATSTE